MQLPALHMNGSSPRALRDRYSEARHMVRDALEYMQEHGAPNGRDYYPINSDAASVAMAEHREHLKKLESVLDDLTRLTEHCAAHCKDD